MDANELLTVLNSGDAFLQLFGVSPNWHKELTPQQAEQERLAAERKARRERGWKTQDEVSGRYRWSYKKVCQRSIAAER